VIPGFAVLVVYLVESFRRHMSAERERQQVRTAFSHYMSPAMVEKLAQNPEALQLGGEMRDMTIMFCDIRGFTTISEQFDAQGLTSFINRFLTPMTEVILTKSGTIDKYIGDCIMAFWNAPLDDAAHAPHACEAALGMLVSLKELNHKLKEEALHDGRVYIPVNIGIGINSGVCCVGNMGSNQRFDYSVLGDDVNLTSRLEGQSKYYGVSVVIGQKTAAQVPELAIVEIDMIQVKGKTEAVRIFALLGGRELATNKAFVAFREAFSAMMSDYHMQDWHHAALNLQDAEVKARLAMEDDAPTGLFDLYRQRIDHYRSAPPVAGWTGVYVAQTK
jgi:adenylate cyclase